MEKKVASWSILVAALLGAVREVSAEPYLALLTGAKCSQCHVNRTGGGGRNAFGSAWAQTQLPIAQTGVRNRNLNDWVAIGFDVRARFGAAVTTTTPQTAFEIPESQLQVEAQVVPNLLTVYVDQTIGPDRALTREAFGLLQWKPANGYVKAGKMLLPFGWRIWDNFEYIRSQTGFTYLTPDVGMEIGVEPGPLSWFVALTNGEAGGPEGNNGKMVTSQAAVVFPGFRLGASASHNALANGRRNVVGGFGGAKVGPIIVLAEADWILERTNGVTPRDQFAGFVEANVWARRGVNGKVAIGYHDPNLDAPDDRRIRTRFGVEVFPVNAIQLGAFYELFDDGTPGTADRVSLEAHLHF